ncbi:MAG TPA: fluoride efflux transporter CrcB [Acidimicrobiales bacterium]|jgi:CrcB protein
MNDTGDEDGATIPVDPDLPAAPASSGRIRWRRRGRVQPEVLIAIAAGGALGSPARYEVTRLIHVAPGTFPWATFWTNVTGSLVLGFALILIIEHFPPTRYLRPFFAVGFLGAYTTFSTYMVETATLVKDGHGVIALTYVLTSAVAGFSAVWIGILAGRLIASRSSPPEERSPT